VTGEGLPAVHYPLVHVDVEVLDDKMVLTNRSQQRRVEFTFETAVLLEAVQKRIREEIRRADVYVEDPFRMEHLGSVLTFPTTDARNAYYNDRVRTWAPSFARPMQMQDTGLEIFQSSCWDALSLPRRWAPTR
jgi:hypothetical protein